MYEYLTFTFRFTYYFYYSYFISLTKNVKCVFKSNQLIHCKIIKLSTLQIIFLHEISLALYFKFLSGLILQYNSAWSS